MSNMQTKLSNHSTDRRQFLRQAACAALGATTIVNTLATLRLTSAAIAAGSSQSDQGGYKAIVCLGQSGGNDSNNMLVPSGGAARMDYEAGRGILALPSNQLHALNVPSTTSAFGRYYGGTQQPLGVHPDAPEMAQLFNDGELAFVANVGTLNEPIPDRDALISKDVLPPSDLFSHSNQQMQWQTSVSDTSMPTGWGGRIADLLHAGYNGDDSKVSMSITFGQTNMFMRGVNPESSAFALSANGAKSLAGFSSATTLYHHAYEPESTFAEPIYKNTTGGHRLKALESLVKLTSDNLLENAYAGRVISNRTVGDTINKAVEKANTTVDPATGDLVDFEQIFINADHNLGDQLKMVARLIAGREKLGNNRQIFYIDVGGYDIHKSHLGAHAMLMEELSTGLKAFRDALKATDDWDNVVTYTISDFNRTFTPNGVDDTAGTDHAWGGHAVVMGGPVDGGKVYGHFPALKLGDHALSIDSYKERGRFIPTTSPAQYLSVLTRWFGVESSAIDEIFPTLHRFDDPLTSTLANMNYIPGVFDVG